MSTKLRVQPCLVKRQKKYMKNYKNQAYRLTSGTWMENTS